MSKSYADSNLTIRLGALAHTRDKMLREAFDEFLKGDQSKAKKEGLQVSIDHITDQYNAAHRYLHILHKKEEKGE